MHTEPSTESIAQSLTCLLELMLVRKKKERKKKEKMQTDKCLTRPHIGHFLPLLLLSPICPLSSNIAALFLRIFCFVCFSAQTTDQITNLSLSVHQKKVHHTHYWQAEHITVPFFYSLILILFYIISRTKGCNMCPVCVCVVPSVPPLFS